MSSTRTSIFIMSCLLGRAKLQLKKKRMCKLQIKNRRESTIARDNEIHRLYKEIVASLGEVGNAVSKSYIYEKIKEQTKLSVRTISFVLNHTEANKSI